MNRLLARLVIAAAALCWAASVLGGTAVTPIAGGGRRHRLAGRRPVRVPSQSPCASPSPAAPPTIRWARAAPPQWSPRHSTRSTGPYGSTSFAPALENLATGSASAPGQDEFGGSMRMLDADVRRVGRTVRCRFTDPRSRTSATAPSTRRDPAAPGARPAPACRAGCGSAPPSRRIPRRQYRRHRGERHSDHAQHRRLRGTPHPSARDWFLAVVGDITATEAAALIEHVFGGLHQGETTQIRAGGCRCATTSGNRPLPQSIVTFAQRRSQARRPELVRRARARRHSRRQQLRGRLMQEIRERGHCLRRLDPRLVRTTMPGSVLGSITTGVRGCARRSSSSRTK